MPSFNAYAAFMIVSHVLLVCCFPVDGYFLPTLYSPAISSQMAGEVLLNEC